MSTWVLPADTLLSTLLPAGGGSLASGDTIDFNGHTLVMDCDAGAYPFTPTNVGSVPCKLELRDLSRIKLNAALPGTVSPWVDPEHPLPVSTPGVAEGVDGYVTGLTVNARAEIRLAGNFGLGGGAASLPTETRNGAFWARAIGFPSTNQITFDRDFPLHSGDKLVWLSGNNHMEIIDVASYDAGNLTATALSTVSNRIVGNVYGLIAGGVAIVVSNNAPLVITSPMVGGTLVFVQDGNGNYLRPVIGSSVKCKRILSNVRPRDDAYNDGGLVYTNGTLSAEQACSFYLFAGGDSSYNLGNISINIGEGAFGSFGKTTNAFRGGALALNAGIVVKKPSRDNASTYQMVAPTGQVWRFSNVDFPGGQISFAGNSAMYYKNCRVSGTVVGDALVSQYGVVTRVARSDFPTDTDLPDAFYFAPATASDVPWRYEDYWVRKGETLRLSCRAMRGGDNGAARVAIGEMAVWVPAAGMPTLAEWGLDSGEPLVWRGGQIAWTNNTGEDCQVRVWSMASGIHGAYIRVWRATGGAM